MLDIAFIRNNPDLVKASIKKRSSGSSKSVDKLLDLDKDIRLKITKIEKFQQERNKISSTGQKPSEEDIVKVKNLKSQIASLEKEKKTQQQVFQALLDYIPNIPRDDTPNGNSEEQNLDIYAWTPEHGEISTNKLNAPGASLKYMPTTPPHTNDNFTMRDHVEIGKILNIIDVKQSAKVSGSRFCYLLNDAVLLQYSLFELLKNKLIKEGFIPMVPPLLVKERSLYGTSHFPADKEQIYKIDTSNVEENTRLYLVGSSEPSLFSYYMDKTVEVKDLPIKMFAYTSCFRSEVGSWGTDVRGIKRVHQFDKLEMDVICHPTESEEMAEEYLLGINKWLFRSLEIPFRIVRKCYGDMGYLASHTQWDPESWLPSQNKFMEVGTSTNTTDYQARRLNIKFRNANGTKQFVHTCNDTGVAIGRTIISIIDNYQQKDGSVKIPKILQEYMGKDVIKPS